MRIIFASCFLLFVVNILAQNTIIPGFSVNITSPEAKGYYFFSPIKLGANKVSKSAGNILMDEMGNIIYFKKYSEGNFSGDFKLNLSGLISFYVNDKVFLMDSAFKIIDSITCKKGLLFDPHEFLILPNGHYVILSLEDVKMNLQNYKLFNKKGQPGEMSANVKCTVLQELDRQKNVVFEWHIKDHYTFDYVDTMYLSNPREVDWAHCNSVEKTKDGNYILSIRNFNQVAKIDGKNGKVLWRLGGKNSSFHFINDPHEFKGQHDARVLTNGHITLYDNGLKSKPIHPEGGKEYQLDETKRTVKLVWSHIPDKSLWSVGYGNVQRLPNGNTLVNFGGRDQSKLIFDITAPDSKKIMELVSNDSLSNYRAYYYKDLPFKLKRPKVNCIQKNGKWILEAEDGFSDYIWSNGQTSKSLIVGMEGSYYVCVPVGIGGWICSDPIYFDKMLSPVKLK